MKGLRSERLVANAWRQCVALEGHLALAKAGSKWERKTNHNKSVPFVVAFWNSYYFQASFLISWGMQESRGHFAGLGMQAKVCKGTRE